MEKICGLNWECKYSCYSVVVGGWLKLSFHYESGNFQCRVNEMLIKKTQNSALDAATECVHVAKKLLAKATLELEGK